jgi:Trypsin-like peptidase domain
VRKGGSIRVFPAGWLAPPCKWLLPRCDRQGDWRHGAMVEGARLGPVQRPSARPLSPYRSELKTRQRPRLSQRGAFAGALPRPLKIAKLAVSRSSKVVKKMFQAALPKVQPYTQPVIDLWKRADDALGGGIASCVIVNDEGWIITCAHVVKASVALAKSAADARAWEMERNKIKTGASLSAKERSRKIAALGTVHRKAPIRAGTAWGHNGSSLRDIVVLEDIDLAVGRLDPFDPSWVTQYPVFKDPSKNFPSGASLCKLGYPFIELKPVFDEATSTFSLPPDQRQLALFPIEGIFTRTLVVSPGGAIKPYPLQFLETSSPGLRGQSGGPTFDTNGAIWAIQAQTRHQPLGFTPEVEIGGKKHQEHQFLNVGMGIDVTTVIGFLEELGIKHQLSAN